MRRITPRTCLWPLVWCLCATFALSIGLTYRSDHHCYAGVCGEWLFPLQARLHVIVWYMWLSISTSLLTLRAFQPAIRDVLSRPLGVQIPLMGKQLRIGGLLLVFWVCALYGILISIWWRRLSQYFDHRGHGLSGNNLVAAIAQTGHLADVTMGMVLLPVSRHSALGSFLKLSPSTTYTFHMTQAYVLFALVLTHGSLYAAWVAMYNKHPNLYRYVLPALNPTYLYNEVWPGDRSSLGVWRASLIFSGSVTSLIMLAMFLTSFPAIRRKYFNLFYFVHLLAILGVIVICLHASTMFYCTIPGLSMWLLDWGMRLLELRWKIGGRLRALGNGWYTLTLPLPRNRLSGCACHSPLAHFYIHHSQSSLHEIHPFTTITHLASQKSIVPAGKDQSIDVQFLFRQSVPNKPSITPDSPPLSRTRSRQWTNRLAELADEESQSVKNRYNDNKEIMLGQPVELELTDSAAVSSSGVETSLRLEGPYFNSANPELYKTVMCFVAGTGLSGALAIAAAFKARREASCFASGALDSSSSPDAAKQQLACTMSPGVTEHWSRCVVVWSVRDDDYVDMPFFADLACAGLQFIVHRTGGQRKRLDFRSTLTEICGERSGTDTWVYISGPNRFIAAASEACQQLEGLTCFEARWD